MMRLVHKFITPSARKLYGLLGAATATTIGASLLGALSPVAGAIALAGAFTLPGIFVIMALRLKRQSVLEFLIYAAGLSTLFLILTGLSANLVLQAWGNHAPLSTGSFTPWYSTSLIMLFLASAWYNRHRHYRLILPTMPPQALRWVGGFALLPVLSALGAHSLNQGGSSVFTMIAFGLIAAAAIGLVVRQKVVPAWVWPWAIFNMALAILWSISLRGSYITGHDVQLEYYVFRLTDMGSRWTMANLHDAYNACLSITILPTVVKSLTRFDAFAQYKVIYQALFALFATGVMAISRHYASNAIAFIASFMFITFPTFLLDMPMLVRQEIAFGFFIMLIMALYGDSAGRWQRRLLYGSFGIGLVLSHYSTTFVAAGIFTGAYLVLQPQNLGWFGLKRPHFRLRRTRPLTLGVVAVITIGTSLWTGLYTQTGNNISAQIVKIEKNLPSLLNPATGSETASYTLLKSHKASDQELVDQYAAEAPDAAITASPANPTYANASHYPLKATREPSQPLTGLGRWLTSLGIPAASLTAAAKTGYALAIQGLVLVGIIVISLRRRRLGMPSDFIALAPVGVALIVFQAIMPVIEYGLFRMLQQDLVFLALPLTLGALQLLSWLRLRNLYARTVILAAGFALGFLVLSGFTGQIFGGSPGQLALSNSGFYYQAYYTTKADTSLFSWLNNNYQAGYPINSDMFLRMKILANTGITTVNTIAPGSLTKQSYVVLGNENVTAGRVSLYYHGGALLSYSYPTAFLDDNKDLLYSSRDAKVYR